MNSKNYDSSEILNKIIKTQSGISEIDGEDIKFEFQYTVSPKGERVNTLNVYNIKRVLLLHPKIRGRIRYDEFSDQIMIDKRPFTDRDLYMMMDIVTNDFTFLQKLKKSDLSDAIFSAAQEDSYNPFVEYVSGLKWDGVNRLSTWLPEVFGCEENLYSQKVGETWFKGMVYRALYPGAKYDQVLVLEGRQGTGKSKAFAVLGGKYTKHEAYQNWHLETVSNVDGKDFYMTLQGKLIIEFSEGETLSRTDVKKMKAIITQTYDRYRVPFGRFVADFPRKCVFAMTTNMTDYLKDETGARRWLPIEVKDDVDIDWLIENRDQLFAEAYHYIEVKGESIFYVEDEIAREEQEKRRFVDSNEEAIMEWYEDLPLERKLEGVSTNDVIDEVFNGGFKIAKKDRKDQMIAAKTLQYVMKLDRERKTVQGRRRYVYVPREKDREEYVRQLSLRGPETKEEFDRKINTNYL